MKGLNMVKKEDAIKIRRGKVLALLSKGYSQAEVAKELRCSEPTISRDVQDMKDEATKSIEDHISEVPFQWERCITSYDFLIRRANELLESDDVDKLSLIKLIADLQKTRLDLYSAPEIMRRAVEHVQKLQNKLAALQKEQHSKGAGFEIIKEVHQTAGQPDKVIRKVVRKKKVEETGPIV